MIPFVSKSIASTYQFTCILKNDSEHSSRI